MCTVGLREESRAHAGSYSTYCGSGEKKSGTGKAKKNPGGWSGMRASVQIHDFT